MITITDGIMTLRVTQGAFKDIFQSQGFFEVSDNTTEMLSEPREIPEVRLPGDTSENTTASISVQETDDAEPEQGISEESGLDLSEIPLSQMTNRQLREYAEQLGVDLAGITSRKAVINKIKSTL